MPFLMTRMNPLTPMEMGITLTAQMTLTSPNTDEDGVGDNADAFPLDARNRRSDGDGVGDNFDVLPMTLTSPKIRMGMELETTRTPFH